MRHADQALQDEALLLIIQQELSRRCKKSKTRGRSSTSEVILRRLLLKHLRDWSFADLTSEVRANLVYREFIRIGFRSTGWSLLRTHWRRQSPR
jgi:IS5 family transposase